MAFPNTRSVYGYPDSQYNNHALNISGFASSTLSSGTISSIDQNEVGTYESFDRADVYETGNFAVAPTWTPDANERALNERIFGEISVSHTLEGNIVQAPGSTETEMQLGTGPPTLTSDITRINTMGAVQHSAQESDTGRRLTGPIHALEDPLNGTLDSAAVRLCSAWLMIYPGMPREQHFKAFSSLTGQPASAIESWFGTKLRSNGALTSDSGYMTGASNPSTSDASDTRLSFGQACDSNTYLQESRLPSFDQLRSEYHHGSDMGPSQMPAPETVPCSTQQDYTDDSMDIERIIDNADAHLNARSAAVARVEDRARTRLRKSCVPACDKNMLQRTPEKPFQCTFKCGRSFKRKDDLRRHEEAKYPQKGWVCNVEKDVMEEGLRRPVYCSDVSSPSDHSEKNGGRHRNLRGDRNKLCGKYSFRREHFLQHFERIHPHLKWQDYIRHGECEVKNRFPKWCGFCERRFETWSWRNRLDHICKHFTDEEKSMQEWVAPRSKDTPNNRGPCGSHGHDPDDYDDDDGSSDDEDDNGDDNMTPRNYRARVSQSNNAVSRSSGQTNLAPNTHGNSANRYQLSESLNGCVQSSGGYSLSDEEDTFSNEGLSPDVCFTGPKSEPCRALSHTTSYPSKASPHPILSGHSLRRCMPNKDVIRAIASSEWISNSRKFPDKTTGSTAVGSLAQTAIKSDNNGTTSTERDSKSQCIESLKPVMLSSLKLLGRGRSGVVDTVVHRQTGSVFARKTFIGTGLHTGHLMNELGTLRALQTTRHMNIINMVGSYSQGFYTSILFSDVADMDLAEFTETRVPSSQPTTRLWGQLGRIADALHFLHYAERRNNTTGPIVHFDLKPQNILVCFGPGQNQFTWKIADFGSSHIYKMTEYDAFEESEKCQRPAEYYGTTIYRAPETYRRPEASNNLTLSLGRASDIWSLGCIFLEVATFIVHGCTFKLKGLQDMHFEGKKSYRENLALSYVWLISLCDEARTSEISKLSIIRAMLSRDPSQRPTALELCDALPFQEVNGYDAPNEEDIERHPDLRDLRVAEKVGQLNISETYQKSSEAVFQSHLEQKIVKAMMDFDFDALDLIRGKGKGTIILLYGPLGVGKIMTGEGIAQDWRSPLSSVTCGDFFWLSRRIQLSINHLVEIEKTGSTDLNHKKVHIGHGLCYKSLV